jgi:hypothetical protein
MSKATYAEFQRVVVDSGRDVEERMLAGAVPARGLHSISGIEGFSLSTAARGSRWVGIVVKGWAILTATGES